MNNAWRDTEGVSSAMHGVLGGVGRAMVGSMIGFPASAQADYQRQVAQARTAAVTARNGVVRDELLSTRVELMKLRERLAATELDLEFSQSQLASARAEITRLRCAAAKGSRRAA